jgi:hypothetical protein
VLTFEADQNKHSHELPDSSQIPPQTVQAPPSAQEPGTHTPSVHVSGRVQALPSQLAGPFGSAVQVAEQQSPLTILPSSHCSPASTVPLPHAAGVGVGVGVGVAVGAGVGVQTDPVQPVTELQV